jgi:hypothetical protein
MSRRRSELLQRLQLRISVLYIGGGEALCEPAVNCGKSFGLGCGINRFAEDHEFRSYCSGGRT